MSEVPLSVTSTREKAVSFSEAEHHASIPASVTSSLSSSFSTLPLEDREDQNENLRYRQASQEDSRGIVNADDSCETNHRTETPTATLSRKCSVAANALRQQYIGSIFDDELSITKHIRGEDHCTSSPFTTASRVRRRVGLLFSGSICANKNRCASPVVRSLFPLEKSSVGDCGSSANEPPVRGDPFEDSSSKKSEDTLCVRTMSTKNAFVTLVSSLKSFGLGCKYQLDEDGYFGPLMAFGLFASIFFLR